MWEGGEVRDKSFSVTFTKKTLRTWSTKSQAYMSCMCSRQNIKLVIKQPSQRKGFESSQDRQCSGIRYQARQEVAPLLIMRRKGLFFTLITHWISIECDRHGEKIDYWEENESKYDSDRKKKGGGG